MLYYWHLDFTPLTFVSLGPWIHKSMCPWVSPSECPMDVSQWTWPNWTEPKLLFFWSFLVNTNTYPQLFRMKGSESVFPPAEIHFCSKLEKCADSESPDDSVHNLKYHTHLTDNVFSLLNNGLPNPPMHLKNSLWAWYPRWIQTQLV